MRHLVTRLATGVFQQFLAFVAEIFGDDGIVSYLLVVSPVDICPGEVRFADSLVDGSLAAAYGTGLIVGQGHFEEVVDGTDAAEIPVVAAGTDKPVSGGIAVGGGSADLVIGTIIYAESAEAIVVVAVRVEPGVETLGKGAEIVFTCEESIRNQAALRLPVEIVVARCQSYGGTGKQYR